MSEFINKINELKKYTVEITQALNKFEDLNLTIEVIDELNVKTQNLKSMPRTIRLKSSSGFYHVILRGINHQHIFEVDSDFVKFQQLLYKKCFPEDQDGNPMPACCVWIWTRPATNPPIRTSSMLLAVTNVTSWSARRW